MPLSPSEYERLAAFRYRLRQFLSFSDSAAAGVGLTQNKYQALLALRAHRGADPLTISGLAAQMLIKHHSAVGMVNRLEEQGLIRREPARGDRRKVGIRLTPRGIRVFDKLATMQRGELARIGADMGTLMKHFARAARVPPAAPGGRKRRS